MLQTLFTFQQKNSQNPNVKDEFNVKLSLMRGSQGGKMERKQQV
jgi:hypothetical protein